MPPHERDAIAIRGSVPTLALGGRGHHIPLWEREPQVSDEPVPTDDPQTGDSNEGADEKAEIVEPDGSPSPRAEPS